MNLGDFGLRKSPADEHRRSKVEREFGVSEKCFLLLPMSAFGEHA